MTNNKNVLFCLAVLIATYSIVNCKPGKTKPRSRQMPPTSDGYEQYKNRNNEENANQSKYNYIKKNL